ncbi:hypothetical protein LTR02_009103 [Friedmanniomyces endolithicus]|nr:hypothetical protein LTR02_009103 [Friedmanniomyces endolithicus]
MDAEDLEEQATLLRQLAFRRRCLDMNAHAPQYQLTQQQISQYNLSQQQQLSQQEHMMHFAQPSVPGQITFGADPSETSCTPYHFDSSTIFRPDLTLEPGSTPGIENHRSWDVSTHQQSPRQIDTEHSMLGHHQQDYTSKVLSNPTQITAGPTKDALAWNSVNDTGLARMNARFTRSLREPNTGAESGRMAGVEFRERTIRNNSIS